MRDFLLNFPEFNSELKEVNKLIKNTIGHPSELIYNPIFQTIHSNQALVGPSLLIVSSKFGKYQLKKILPLAVAVELLRTATLMHGDVLDISKVRSGVTSVHSKFGKDRAVYSGDYIIAKSLMLINEQYDPKVIQHFSKRISNICISELKQYNLRYNSNISFYDYIKIITGKSASLFAMSMYTGAKLGEVEEDHARLLALTGLRAGIAYQIAHDCLDYAITDEPALSSFKNQLKQGFYTLPIICALKNDVSQNLRDLLDSTHFNDNDILKIHNLVIKNDGVKNAKEYSKRYTNKSFDALKRLPPCEGREMLQQLLDTLLTPVIK